MKSHINIYDKLEFLPIACYDLIQKSIATGKPEYRWLLKFDYEFDELPEYSDITKLKDIFENLTYQFDDLDLDLQSLYIKSVKAFTIFNQKKLQLEIKELENTERKIVGKEIINYNKVNTKIGNVYKAFDAYRAKLNDNFTDFVFTEFFIETENEHLKGFTFYTENQLLAKLAFHNLEIDYSLIQHREKSFDHIDFLHKYFYDFYQEIDRLNDFFEFRLEFFDLSNLRCKPKRTHGDLDKNIVILETILKKDIDKWKISVKKYQKMQKVASEINKSHLQKH